MSPKQCFLYNFSFGLFFYKYEINNRMVCFNKTNWYCHIFFIIFLIYLQHYYLNIYFELKNIPL